MGMVLHMALDSARKAEADAAARAAERSRPPYSEIAVAAAMERAAHHLRAATLLLIARSGDAAQDELVEAIAGMRDALALLEGRS